METAVLGVECSLTDKRWVANDADPDAVAAIVRTGAVNEVVARLLAGRGVLPENVAFYLTPSFKNNLPDPLILKGADKASERIAKAVTNGEKIGVFGDYDVDGATSTSLMVRFLNAVGCADVAPRIPEREEGYGPTPEAMRDFIADGVKLIVTVDCGTSAFEALDAAKGTDVVVIDHHEPDVVLPDVCAVVNPKRLDEPLDNPCRHMAAVGVVFMVLIAVNRLLREQGWYTPDRPEPDLRQWLDLVALGTVCDVVRLRGLNRLFVKAGLSCMARGSNKGLSVLREVSKVKDAPTAFHLGYLMGPRLNACGRIGRAGLGMKLLCAKDEAEAREIAAKLDELNTLRRQMCEEIYKQAIGQVESAAEPQEVIFAYGKDWHAGVIGIIAGRLKERYNVPALVMSGADVQIHGSGRSVAGYDLGAAILAAKEKGILTAGGGHTLAAGFSLMPEKLDEFKAFIPDYFAMHKTVDKPANDYIIDSVVDIGAVSWDLVQTVSSMEPFGEGNPEPRFAVADVAVASAFPVGSGHVSCTFVGRNGRTRLRAIAFNAADSDLGVSLLNHKGALFHVAGYLRPDTYRGEGNVQLIIEDLARAS